MKKIIAILITATVALAMFAVALYGATCAINYLYTQYASFFVGCGCGLIRVATVATVVWVAGLIFRVWNTKH